MRDLFQVVFELKKKEIELAKQHIEQNAINAIKFHTGGIFVEPAPDTKVSSVPRKELLSSRYLNSSLRRAFLFRIFNFVYPTFSRNSGLFLSIHGDLYSLQY